MKRKLFLNEKKSERTSMWEAYSIQNYLIVEVHHVSGIILKTKMCMFHLLNVISLFSRWYFIITIRSGKWNE